MHLYNKIIVIEVSTICNLSCPFCGHDNHLKVPRFTIDRETLKTFAETVGKFSKARGESVLISWLGGEPLLNKNVLSLTEELKDHFPLHFSATTNGTKLSDRAIRDHIRLHYSELTVSVDGFSSFHDKIRGRDGLFEEIRIGIKELAQEAPDLKIRINTVLMRSNFDFFRDLCIEVANWGVEEITFNQLGGRDRPEFYPDNRLLIEQTDRIPALAQEIQNAIKNTKAKLIFSESYFRRISASARGDKLPILDCKPGSYYVFVNARGNISPCSFTTDEYGLDISSIRTTDDFEQLPSIFHQKKTSNQANWCHDCPNTNVHGKFS